MERTGNNSHSSGNNSNVTGQLQVNSALHRGSHGRPHFLNLLLPAQVPRHLLRNRLHSSHSQALSSLGGHISTFLQQQNFLVMRKGRQQERFPRKARESSSLKVFKSRLKTAEEGIARLCHSPHFTAAVWPGTRRSYYCC